MESTVEWFGLTDLKGWDVVTLLDFWHCQLLLPASKILQKERLHTKLIKEVRLLVF